jgi:hypothetical protein
MANDIAARLRDIAECPTPLRAYFGRALALNAADEIERLCGRLAAAEESAEHWQRIAMDARANVATPEGPP